MAEINKIRPPALKRGDKIAIAAPSSPLAPESLRAGIARIEQRGYEAVYRDDIFERNGFLAGDDQRRADELNQYFADPDISAIIAARGGYGAARLAELLDLAPLSDHPKIIVGYSDQTALHLIIQKQIGISLFHGPMAATDLGENADEQSISAFWDMIEGNADIIAAQEGVEVRTLIGGKAAGPIIGGCLSLVAASAGAPYFPDAAGSILLLEDWRESPFRIDRMINQLYQSGMLDNLAGMIFGRFIEAAEPDRYGITTSNVIEDWANKLAIPTVFGFPTGHSAPNLTIPLGVDAELDADAGIIRLLEHAVQK